MSQLLGGRKTIKKKIGLKQSQTFRKLFVGVAPIFCLAFLTAFLAASIFAPINTSNAAETTIQTSVALGGYTLNLSVSSSVNLAVNANNHGVMTVEESDVVVSTTVPSGYQLYLGMTGAKANTNSLVHTTDNTSEIRSTGTMAEPAKLVNGTWGYAIPSGSTTVTNGFDASYTEASSTTAGTVLNNKFASIPTSAPAKIAQTSTANSEPTTIPVFYGVKVGYETSTGTYSNNVLYTALADEGSPEGVFIAPTSMDAGTDTSVQVTTAFYTSTENAKADIYLLTAEQYEGLNGSTNIESLGVSPLTCTLISATPHSYTCTIPGTTSAGEYNVVIKYPLLDKVYSREFEVISVGPSNFFELTTMQEMTPEICATATKPSALATHDDTTGAFAGNTDYVPTKTLVVDDRTDGATNTKHSYTIKKLADGKCWMTENLALVGPFTPSSDDSDVKSTSEFALTGSDTSSWCTTNSSDCDDKSMVINTGATYGVLYNWYAATAGTGTYSTDGANAPSSICPKGWRLPTGGSSGEFRYLYDTAGYNSSSLIQKSTGGPAFVLSGYRNGGSTFGQGDFGHYWSSTARSASIAYRLNLDSSNVTPAGSNNKYYGFSVRCIAQ